MVYVHSGAQPGSGIRAPSRAPTRHFRLSRWSWDVFICHAGEDKPFGLCLHQRLEQFGLRSFLDQKSLLGGSDSPLMLEVAVKSSYIAVVLLSEEFFAKPWPQRELRLFLKGRSAMRQIVVPVFLGISHERCDFSDTCTAGIQPLL